MKELAWKPIAADQAGKNRTIIQLVSRKEAHAGGPVRDPRNEEIIRVGEELLEPLEAGVWKLSPEVFDEPIPRQPTDRHEPHLANGHEILPPCAASGLEVSSSLRNGRGYLIDRLLLDQGALQGGGLPGVGGVGDLFNLLVYLSS